MELVTVYTSKTLDNDGTSTEMSWFKGGVLATAALTVVVFTNHTPLHVLRLQPSASSSASRSSSSSWLSALAHSAFKIHSLRRFAADYPSTLYTQGRTYGLKAQVGVIGGVLTGFVTGIHKDLVRRWNLWFPSADEFAVVLAERATGMQITSPQSTYLQYTCAAPFYRAMLRISTAYAVMQCPSVCPSIMFMYSVKTNKCISTIFSPSGSHIIQVFLYQRLWQYSDRDPPP